jgi:hypothetical protein
VATGPGRPISPGSIRHPSLDNTKLAAVERYFRIFSGPRKAPLLVWSLCSKAIDPFGQFFKVAPRAPRRAAAHLSQRSRLPG